ncbi:MAG: RNA polymerase sigma factor [Bacteroidales bacterium]|jgi:RNA polymerase sigma-70 factor (ECF subfamily)|nr:RNA polymerase sigma factor [Bacteroidales bacterium]
MDFKDNHMLSDEKLIEKIVVEKQSNLYEILFGRYYQRVLEKCISLVKNHDIAEELTKDILTKTYENLGSFKGNSSFGTWLYSITYNYCIDYLRAKNKLHYPNWNLENELPEIIDEIEEDLTEIHYKRLMRVLDLLHTEEKALLLMKYQDDLSLKQISEALRLSEGAVKMRIKRAKARVLFIFKNAYGSYN